jgi:hypothetical protein
MINRGGLIDLTRNSAKTNCVKWSIFISSYIPLYFFILIITSDKLFGLFRPQKNWCEYSRYLLKNSGELLFIIVLVLVIIYSFWTVRQILNASATNHNIIVCDVKSSQDTIISYIATYLLPLTTLDNGNIRLIIANVGLFLVIGFLYVKLNLIYLNPTFLFFGYVPYFSKSKIIISNVSYEKLRNNKSQNRNDEHEKKWNGAYIANGIVVIRKEDNE